MPHSVASDLGLHCLPITLLGSPHYNGLKYKLKYLQTKFEDIFHVIFFFFFF